VPAASKVAASATPDKNINDSAVSKARNLMLIC